MTVPARQGLEAVDILRRGAGDDAVGPVLHDGGGDTLGFLVPPGTAAGWDLPGSACTQTFGRGLRRDPPSRRSAGAGWLLPPAATATRSPIRPCCGRPWARRPALSRPPTAAAEATGRWARRRGRAVGPRPVPSAR